MKSILLIVFSFFMITSCKVTKSDATNWFDDHKEDAAEYCSEKFPTIVKTDTLTNKQDSTAYFKALSNLWRLTDSTRIALEQSGKIDSFYLDAIIPCIGNEIIIRRTEINRDSVALLTMRIRGYQEREIKKDIAIETLQKESEKNKQKAKNRLWIIIAFAATMFGIIIIKLK